MLDEGVADSVDTILQGVVKNGTGTRAPRSPACSVAGKTGTTENYGDAWFVGFTPEYTVAVWVGYPNKFKPMKTEFQGEPVAGGTFPAGIWKTFMESVLKIDPPPELKKDADGHAGRAAGAPTVATGPPPPPRRRADAAPAPPRPSAADARAAGRPRRRSRRTRHRSRRPTPRPPTPAPTAPPADGGRGRRRPAATGAAPPANGAG